MSDNPIEKCPYYDDMTGPETCFKFMGFVTFGTDQICPGCGFTLAQLGINSPTDWKKWIYLPSL